MEDEINMNKRWVLLIVLILMFAGSCSKDADLAKNQEEKPKNEVPKPIEDGLDLVVEIRDRIHPSMQECLFKIYGEKKEYFYSANKLTISSVGEEKLIQEILIDETETADSENLGLLIEDMNFDEYKDIRVQQFLPAGPNVPYYYWLWDSKSSQFITNKELEEITAPEFDHENKIIKSYVRVNAVAHTELIYKFINGVPTIIRETESVADIDNKVFHITIKELKDNEMKVIKEYDEPIKDER